MIFENFVFILCLTSTFIFKFRIFVDSWDFIKPPAKDPNRDLFRERKSIDDNNPCYCLLKGVRKKLSRRKEPGRNKKRVESSTSLILKKTTERQVCAIQLPMSDVFIIYSSTKLRYFTCIRT